MKKNELTVVFAGNPNCGKTTLFNAYTGARLKVANLPGVTVEQKEGSYLWKGRSFKLVDLPGVYSLDGYSQEEALAAAYIRSGQADLIVNVVDASALERSLCLTLALMGTRMPVVMALNMIDIVEKRGMKLDVGRLSERLGIPIIEVSGREGRGLDALMQAVADCSVGRRSSVSRPKWALDESELGRIYAHIEQIVDAVLVEQGDRPSATDRADRLLTHRLWGFPLFLLIMCLVFTLTFIVGDLLKGGLAALLDGMSRLIRTLLDSARVAPPLVSLLTEGVWAGMSAVLSFLPNIAILFALLVLLEDSGYMARAAYVADRLMRSFGLSGRAFLPMLLGFGCTVPAVMATRTLESASDRHRLMWALPYISCSARLPVYLLLSSLFFGKYAALVACSMLLIGLLVSLTVARLTALFEKESEVSALLIELPDYKLPSLRTVVIGVWEKVKSYLTRAGTVIFLASLVLWFLRSYNFGGQCALTDSFAAQLGRGLQPLLAPCGLGYWQIALSLISGLAGKEVVVSSLGVLFGIDNIAAASGMAALHSRLASVGFTAANAYAVMLFVLLYSPCAAAIAAIYRESGSLKRTLASVALQIGVAWTVSTLFYQIASLFP